MRRLLIAICLMLAVPGMCFGAIPATMVWEIRADGNNTNGCGFDGNATVGGVTKGTDYSQQAASQDDGADLATADGDVAGCVVTSASHAFAAADVGNMIHITAGTGWTAGWYEIVSVAADAATLDRACGTDGAKTSGLWRLGGACNIKDTLDGDMFAALVAGNTVWIRSGTVTGDGSTFTAGENISATAGSSETATVKVYGYGTTRNDTPGYLNGITNDSRPTIAGGATKSFTFGNYTSLKNLRITNSTGTTLTLGTYTDVNNVYISNTGTTGGRYGVAAQDYSYFNNSEIHTSGTTATDYAVQLGSAGKIFNSYVSGPVCISLGANAGQMVGNILTGCTSYGITGPARNNSIILNNTIYTPTAGTSVGISSTGTRLVIKNNIIAGFATGITAAGANLYEDYNSIYCTDDGLTNKGTHDDNTTDPGFVSAATGDFRVTAKAIKDLGYPNSVTLPGTSVNGKGYNAVGALQPISGGTNAWAH